MRASTSVRMTAQRKTIRAMIRWIAAITVTALLATAASADISQGGASANGPITLGGAGNRSATSGSSSPSGDTPIKTAPTKPGTDEPMMIVPPAVIPSSTGVNSATKTTVPATPSDPLAEKIWPPVNETRGLGRANKSAASPSSSDQVKSAAATPPAVTSSRFSLFSSEAGRVLGALAVVIGLAVLTRYFMKRAGGMMQGGDRPSGVVEILARYPVARGQHLVLLKLARRIMLLHQNGSSMTTLSEMSDPDEVASLLARLEAGSSGRTAERFQKVLRTFETEHEHLPEIHTVSPARLAHTSKDDSEIIDLTRSRMRDMAAMLMGKVGR